MTFVVPSLSVIPVITGGVLAVSAAGIALRSITRPLNRLIAAVQESERNGRFEPGFPENSRITVVNELAGALNRAAESVRSSESALDHAYLQFIETMARALDARDPYTAGHSVRVGAYSYAIAREMGIPAFRAEEIRIAAQLHDIGKIGVPDAILQKPAALTPEEYGLVKLHPQIGRKILEKVGKFENLLAVVELHHENHDGSGYPYGLSQERIPLEARIVHVADCFDAMTTTRSYRAGLSQRAAIEELRVNAGFQFDPDVVDAFLKVIASGRQDQMLLASERGLLLDGAPAIREDSLPQPHDLRQ